ncbi:MAG TPA: hypothetical protein VGA02_04965 [Gemmatimonadales bacterium]
MPARPRSGAAARRIALGAESRQILRSIFARAGRQILLGVALGLAGVTLLDFLGEGMLLGGRGAILIPSFAVMMGVVAALAGVGPARRAVRIEPTEALRAEAGVGASLNTHGASTNR